MTSTEQASDIYGLSANTLEGKPAPLAQYRGQVTLIVNVEVSPLMPSLVL